jgi:hypothetical protein
VSDTARPPASWTLLAAILGFLAGCYPIANTSIGWHLASGHWILDQRTVPTTDPFSFASGGAPWVDHEWLFQVVVATVETVTGAAGLTVLRALLVAAMATLLFLFARRGGLSPPAALVLAALCLYGARIRFFLRPELATLLLAPTVIWLFISRRGRASTRTTLWIALLMAVGANLHGGILVVPPLLAGMLAAEVLQWLVRRSGPSPLASGAACLAAAAAAPVLNPYGWRLYAVPLEISHLVGLEHIPNPEWISPSFADVPPLYVAVVLGAIGLALAERRATRWMVLVMASALALRYVRNVGLFFMLYPIAVAPAFASLPLLGRGGLLERRATLRVAAVAVSLTVVVAMALLPGRAPGLGFSDRYYPGAAWTFIQQQELVGVPAYNDVRFGGFLIHQHYPERRTFLDDRNEIHEPLLAEIHAILGSSDPDAWQAMLDRHGIDLAWLRYNPPFRVVTPDGAPAGWRGFSALWFPATRWALIYWDDVAMVLIERAAADPALLARHEYRAIRPDDVEHLGRRMAVDPDLRRTAARELARKLAEQPDCVRALELSRMVMTVAP